MDLDSLYCNHHELSNCDCCIETRAIVAHPEAYFMRHYAACVTAALPILKSMLSDLITHDRMTLRGEDPSIPFVFACSASSTHLIRLTEHDGAGHWAPQYPTWIGDTYISSQPISWFFWDGETMTPLANSDEAIEVLYEECAKIGLTPE
jgi:hypothetical protein